MAHIRKPLAAAATLNAAIFLGEAWAGLRASSLSLLGDAVHNFSDQLALVCLLLAYRVTTRASRHFQRSANLLNSAGLLAISAVLVWQALERVFHPQPLIG
jgi:cobalt-zinc-cadmium efflux system protein